MNNSAPIGPRQVAAESLEPVTFPDVIRAYGLEKINDFIPRYVSDNVMFPELDTYAKAEVHVWVHLRGVLDDMRAQAKRKKEMLESYDGDPMSPSPLNPHRGKYRLSVVRDITDTLTPAKIKRMKAVKMRRFEIKIDSREPEYCDVTQEVIDDMGQQELDKYLTLKAIEMINASDAYPAELDGSQGDRDNYDNLGR